MQVYIESYGCTANFADGNLIADLLKNSDHSIVSKPEVSDVIIINTCTVRSETEQRMILRIRELSRLGPRLIVAGCLAGAEPGIVRKISRDISLVAPQAVDNIVKVVESSKPVYSFRPGPRHHLPSLVNGVKFMIPVAEGCRGSCAFCIVRVARGALRSYPLEEIVEAVRRAVGVGAKEIQLTAQDTASYGFDIGLQLPDLLRRICTIPGRFMVRVGMMNPDSALEILDDLVDAYRSEKIYKFLHIPVQSGDNGILKIMRRKYDVDSFKRIVEVFRGTFPEISIATDVIVGFPGETKEAFANTCRLLREVRPDKVHVARFTVRPHTIAARMPQLPEWVKKRRSKVASDLVRRIGIEINQRFVGKTIRCLVTGLGSRGGLEARTPSYKPVIFYDCDSLIGRFVKIRVTDARSFGLFGELEGVN